MKDDEKWMELCHRVSKDQNREKLMALIEEINRGEGWHNNHHAHPTSARHGLRWYEIDMNWDGIWMLHMLGLARQIKLEPWTPLFSGRLVWLSEPADSNECPALAKRSGRLARRSLLGRTEPIESQSADYRVHTVEPICALYETVRTSGRAAPLGAVQ